MEIVFRELVAGPSASGAVSLPAAPGEILLHPKSGDAARIEMADHVLRHGVGGLLRGEGEPSRLVVGKHPTLDDMLAAVFVERLLAGEELPPGAQAFARYAALAREGLRPSDLPLEASLEGHFLATLNLDAERGHDLTEPGTAARFLAAWRVMARRILEAIAQGLDPFTTPLFESSPDFARARRYLAQDRSVYRQGDVPRGQKWRVQLPGGPPTAAALLLRQPKSLLFKHWARSDADAPGGKGYLFLVVQRDPVSWVVSTDPVHRLSLAPLAARLQAAEARRDAARAADDPWFDGEPFNHTLIGSPRSGTRLSEGEVLGVVKAWAGARPVSGWIESIVKSRPAAALLAGAALLLVALGLFGVIPLGGGGDGGRRGINEPTNRGSGRTSTVWTSLESPMGLRALCIGIAKYEDSRYRLDYADSDAVVLARSFQQQKELFRDKGVETKILLNEAAAFDSIIKEIDELRERCTQHDLTVLTLSGHGLMSAQGEYYFMPYDYKPGRPLTATAISEEDFRKSLDDFPGAVLLVLDTCHSGKFVSAGTRGAMAESELKSAMRQFAKIRDGLVVFTACMPEELARESADWRHGALSLAMIEGLTGKYLVAEGKTPLPPSGDQSFITVKDLDQYVTYRVRELAGASQCVVTDAGGLPTQNIPIAVASRAAAAATAAGPAAVPAVDPAGAAQ